MVDLYPSYLNDYGVSIALSIQSRMSLLRIETEHVVISWKEGIYKIVIGDQKTSHEVMHTHANFTLCT